jgi:hypothetical protein
MGQAKIKQIQGLSSALDAIAGIDNILESFTTTASNEDTGITLGYSCRETDAIQIFVNGHVVDSNVYTWKKDGIRITTQTLEAGTELVWDSSISGYALEQDDIIEIRYQTNTSGIYSASGQTLNQYSTSYLQLDLPAGANFGPEQDDLMNDNNGGVIKTDLDGVSIGDLNLTTLNNVITPTGWYFDFKRIFKQEATTDTFVTAIGSDSYYRVGSLRGIANPQASIHSTVGWDAAAPGPTKKLLLVAIKLIGGKYVPVLLDYINPTSYTPGFFTVESSNQGSTQQISLNNCIGICIFYVQPDGISPSPLLSNKAWTTHFRFTFGVSHGATTPSVTPTPTPVIPTATPVPTAVPTATPTPTPVPPTATPVPDPTATAIEPTATPVPDPTATAIEPTATPVPTATPAPTPVPTVAPTATPIPEPDDYHRFTYCGGHESGNPTAGFNVTFSTSNLINAGMINQLPQIGDTIALTGSGNVGAIYTYASSGSTGTHTTSPIPTSYNQFPCPNL